MGLWSDTNNKGSSAWERATARETSTDSYRRQVDRMGPRGGAGGKVTATKKALSSREEKQLIKEAKWREREMKRMQKGKYR